MSIFACQPISVVIRASFSVSLLIDCDLRVPISIGVHPGRVVLLHVDAAVAAITCERLVAPNIVVRELRAGAKVHAPPGIVYEETAPVIQNRVMNRRIGIPVRRTRGVCRFEHGWRLSILYSPYSRQRGTFYTPGRDVESPDPLAILAEAHSLFNHRNHQHRPALAAGAMLPHLQVRSMHLVISSVVGIVLFQHVQFEQPALLLITHHLTTVSLP